MTEQTDLKALEKKAYQSTFQDGLWDIFIGFLFTQFAIAPILSTHGFGDFWSAMIFLPIYLMVLTGVKLLKKHVVAPRLGQANFSKKRNAKLRLLVLVTTIIGVLGIIAGVFFVELSKLNSQWLFPALFCLILLISFCAAGYLLDLNRFYGYGALTSLAVVVGELLYQNAGASHHGFPIVFGVTSSSIILAGVILFLNFLHKYPKPADDLSLAGVTDGDR